MFTEMVSQIPLVREYTILAQLEGIIKMFGNDSTINRYLRRYGINLPKQYRQSQSYVYADTAAILQKKYSSWSTYLLETVAHCLQINPENRKNAAQLLQLDFFIRGTFAAQFDKLLQIKLQNEM